MIRPGEQARCFMQLVSTKHICTTVLCSDQKGPRPLVTPHIFSKSLQNVSLHDSDASPVAQSSSAGVCGSLLPTPSSLCLFDSLSFFPALQPAHTHREKKPRKYNLHPYILDFCQDTEPKKIPSVDLNYSNPVINELSVIGAALIPKDPTLHMQRHEL